jgi:thiol-disulfide isomerase/thioredoxin
LIIVGFFLGLFLHISKCLNSTLLLNFFRRPYMTIFTSGKKQKQITFKLHLPNQMRPLSILTFLLFTFLSAGAQQANLIKLKDLQQIISQPSDKVLVINFWATWCAPCVKEIPMFEKLNMENKNVDVTLVSMDYDLDPNPEKVYRFITRKKLQSKVVILAEQSPNDWIDKIDKNWSGALPATLIVNAKTGKRKFIQKELQEGELQKLIEEVED